MNPDAQIIILAGGKGKRMGGDLPKVLIEARGRALIEHLLVSVFSLNFKPVVVVGYKGEMVKERLGEKVDYALQEEQLGTGHAVLCAKDVANDAKNIVVLYGDMPNIKPETIENLLRIHSQEQPALTMMTIKVPHFENENAGFYGFGRVIRNEKGEIEKIIELKDASEKEKNIKELNPSLFCFNAEWLWKNLPLIKNLNAQGEYYLTDLAGLAISQGEKITSAEIAAVQCIGVNTPEDLKRAELLLEK